MITQSVNSIGTLPMSGGQTAPAEAAPVELQHVAATAVVNPVVKQLGQKPIDAGEVKKAAEAVNSVLRQFDSRSLQFSVDDDVGVNVVKVVDTQTKELIKQIPSEEMLALARALDKLQGMLVKDKA